MASTSAFNSPAIHVDSSNYANIITRYPDQTLVQLTALQGSRTSFGLRVDGLEIHAWLAANERDVRKHRIMMREVMLIDKSARLGNFNGSREDYHLYIQHPQGNADFPTVFLHRYTTTITEYGKRQHNTQADYCGVELREPVEAARVTSARVEAARQAARDVERAAAYAAEAEELAVEAAAEEAAEAARAAVRQSRKRRQQPVIEVRPLEPLPPPPPRGRGLDLDD